MTVNVCKLASAILLILFVSKAGAQPKSLTLEECYDLARAHYPLIKKQGLIASSSRYSVENASKLYLPQLSLNGQGSFQSQTIDFSQVIPAAGVALPAISKDQYRI